MIKKLNKNIDINTQSGRSMVEMLGTLAIIGVLSIGGIMGYSYGMDKYRANETINDVNLRAMDLITHLTQGATPTLASWAEIGTAGYPISLHTDETTANHYIKVEKVPFRVCDIISDTMPESVVIEVNNDTEQCAEGLNVMYFAYEGFDEGAGDNTGACPTGTSVEGRGSYAGTTDSAGNRCYCIDVGIRWDSASSSCVAPSPVDDKCSSYADCDRGGYCEFNSPSCTKSYAWCRPATNLDEALTHGDFWMLNNLHVEWQTAQDICSSKGMTMVSLKDIGCEDAKDGECTSDTLVSIWSAGMNYPFWTTDVYEENTNVTCDVWSVWYPDGEIYHITRHNYLGVICRK